MDFKNADLIFFQTKHTHTPLFWFCLQIPGFSPGIHEKKGFSNLFGVLAVMVAWSPLQTIWFQLISTELQIQSSMGGSCSPATPELLQEKLPPASSALKGAGQNFRETFLIQNPDICASPFRIQIFMFELLSGASDLQQFP